jgi:hypothetical protein
VKFTTNRSKTTTAALQSSHAVPIDIQWILLSLSPTTALDTVTISPDGDESKITVDQHGRAEMLKTLTFPILHPTVLDLSTLFEVVNSHAPSYTIDEYQCYWYAGATFEVIKLEFNATKTLNPLTKLQRASYKGYLLKKEDKTLTLQKDFITRRDLYAK